MRRISFETAKLAAEKGYDEDCDSVYDIHGNIIDIDNYGLGIIPEYHQSNEVWCGHYEDCLEAGLQAALKLM